MSCRVLNTIKLVRLRQYSLPQTLLLVHIRKMKLKFRQPHHYKLYNNVKVTGTIHFLQSKIPQFYSVHELPKIHSISLSKLFRTAHKLHTNRSNSLKSLYSRSNPSCNSDYLAFLLYFKQLERIPTHPNSAETTQIVSLVPYRLNSLWQLSQV